MWIRMTTILLPRNNLLCPRLNIVRVQLRRKLGEDLMLDVHLPYSDLGLLEKEFTCIPVVSNASSCE